MEKEFTQSYHRSITDTPSAIDVRDFNLWYGDFQALKHITLDIPERRCTAFIGPSGCGKSTLLRTFNRMCDFVETVRHEGAIEFAGEDVFAMDANALRVHVGMVFQHPNPFPMSIRDNVLYGLNRMTRLTRAQADEVLERTLTEAALWDEVKDKLDQSGLGLSGGQQQRLCIARALLRRAPSRAAASAVVSDVMNLGPLSLSPSRHEVSLEGKPLNLTVREFDLLSFLMRSPGVVFNRETLLQRVWGWDFDGGSRTVDVHVQTLRQKLGDHAELIETVRGVGYRLRG